MSIRTSVLAVFALALTSASAAVLPMKLNFQGKLLDPATNAPKNGTFSVQFRVYDGAGNTLWGPETQPSVSVANGVFSVQLGSVLALSPDVFAGGDTWLGVKVGSDSEMTPRQQLLMAPYAFTSAQVAHSSDLRFNAGTAYSTFTSAGNLLVPFGVSAATVTASSNVVVNGGMLDVQGAGGARVKYGVIASTFSGEGADLTDVRPAISSFSANNLFSIAAAGEVMVASVTVIPSRSTSKFIAFAEVGLNRANNNLATWTLRVRRQINGNCTTASTQVGFSNLHTVPNTAGTSNSVSWFKTDAPATTQPVMYCVTASPSGAQTMDERQLTVIEVQ